MNEFNVFRAYIDFVEYAKLSLHVAVVSWDCYYYWELKDDYLERKMRDEYNL